MWYDGRFQKLPWVGLTTDGGSSPPPTFYPTTLPSPLLILDSIQSPYTDVGGGRVSRWDDLSGNANHAVQSTSANQPLYLATGLNSLPGMQIAGSPRGFNLTTGIPTGAKTVYIVAQHDVALASAYYGTMLYSGSAAQTWWALFHTGGASRVEIFATSFVDYTFPTTLSVPSLFSCTNTNGTTAGSCLVYKNGTLQTVTAGSVNSSSTGGHFDSVGLSDSAADWVNGIYAAVYVYGAVHSSTDRAAMEAFLISRFTIV